LAYNLINSRDRNLWKKDQFSLVHRPYQQASNPFGILNTQGKSKKVPGMGNLLKRLNRMVTTTRRVISTQGGQESRNLLNPFQQKKIGGGLKRGNGLNPQGIIGGKRGKAILN